MNVESIVDKLHLDLKDFAEEFKTQDLSYVANLGRDIAFSEDFTELDKMLIKSAITLNSFYEVGDDVYRMVLPMSIFLFKMFGKPSFGVMVGMVVEKNSGNRVEILTKQANYLLNKISGN